VIDPGTVDVVELLVALVLKVALGFVLVGWDERRLARRSPERLERAWPPASKMSAIVVFQEIGIVMHFVRTRGGVLGLVLGLAWAFAYVFAVGLVLSGLELALGPGTG